MTARDRQHPRPGVEHQPGVALASGRVFAALAVPNFRLYLTGQAISLPGTWMQVVAQSWLVLQLTRSGALLGLVAAAQFAPVLLLGPYGGLVADRVDKRKLLLGTQTALGLLALALGLLTVTHLVRLWMVFVLASALGIVNSVDQPTRQTFVPEMVGRDRVQNAVSLNSVLTNGARAVGPAVAGVVIATAGLGVCFLANAASFGAVLVALARIQARSLCPSPPAGRQAGQLRQGLRYVRGAPGFAAAVFGAALAPSLPWELAARAVTGFFSTGFMASGNTTLQLTADPQYRGRVMALWSVTFTGSTPVGGPIVGLIADDLGPRYGLGIGALACLAATIIGAAALARMPPADRYARRPRELDWPAYQQAHETRA